MTTTSSSPVDWEVTLEASDVVDGPAVSGSSDSALRFRAIHLKDG